MMDFSVSTLMDFFSIQTILVHINFGVGGYDLSWIEAIGTLAGGLCIWLASKEKVINYSFGLINVVLFAVIFFQIQLYASLLLQLFFFAANIYGWYAWTRKTSADQHSLTIRWLSQSHRLFWGVGSVIAIGVMTLYIDPVFYALTEITVDLLQLAGLPIQMPELEPDPYPFLDSCVMVLSIVAMILMTRKYVENWLMWVLIDVISVITYAMKGVYAISLEYVVLTFIAISGSVMWIKKAAEQSNNKQ